MKLCTNLRPLTLGEATLVKFAFDGRYYYFTCCGQEGIRQANEEFQLTNLIPTGRVYDCLCFDGEEGCFWATVPESTTRLFQLDCRMREIACVVLPYHQQGKITGLSFDCCGNGILVAFTTGLGIYRKESGEFHQLPSVKGLIMDVLALCPGYFVLIRRGKQQILASYFLNGESIEELVVPSSCRIQCLGYHPCGCEVPQFVALLRGAQCYQKIGTFPLDDYDIGFTPCMCHKKICHCSCVAPPCQGVEQVIESIALVEAAISHILNAQGEELQKVVAGCHSIDEMLEVNQQINKTITKVTHLEQVLYSKLEEITSYGESCCPGLFPCVDCDCLPEEAP